MITVLARPRTNFHIKQYGDYPLIFMYRNDLYKCEYDVSNKTYFIYIGQGGVFFEEDEFNKNFVRI